MEHHPQACSDAQEGAETLTFSILARDSVTGALGAAVASRFFAVGAICLHVEGRVGAMSVQAFPNPMYVRPGMEGLRNEQPPELILSGLIVPDAGREMRQVHLLDRNGVSASHTGTECVDWAGHDAADGVSVAGNMLAGPEVLPAMLVGYADAAGKPFAERLMAAMEAGERAGGDKRGKQSAALKICLDDPYPDLDIRADDSTDPLPELRRLYQVSLERYAVFRRHMPGATSAWGTLDRAIVEADILRHGKPLKNF
ncbi:MAG: DUF1028 domain-containing protein [Janthinobacterium lividum]